MSNQEFLTNIYLWALGLAAAPIFLSFILRKIAGKHAPTYGPDEATDKADTEDEDLWNPLDARINGFRD